MINKLLVANRGEIAARVFRTAHALGISTVAVYSDADAELPYVELADEAVRLPGVVPADTYLRGELIIEAARSSGADAVHPGYGFLSENAGFARDCAEAGLTFVGPSPSAIAAMGSKIEAKRLMAAAGVPVLPGVVLSPDGTPVGPDGSDVGPEGRAGSPDGDGRNPATPRGTVGEVAGSELAEVAAGIGYPLLVKAAFGGGGRGMRVVSSVDELPGAVSSARREAAAAFGDGTVFLERFVVDPRHVEVQILGDVHGTVVHLFERECSIQRRYQKIIEESPSPAVNDQLRAALGDAAVAAGEAIGYTGAGTVEFVVSQSGEFYFLEVNTRLQVEHPVTELVTGLDLVELQLRVAEGEALPVEVLDASIEGHAIEARLYAEDVPAGYLPATGTLHTFAVPAADGIRVDAGYAAGSVVGPHYDPMLAKVIGYGRTRADAARRLARALAGARLHGVTTNRDLLVEILREPGFLAGRTDTGYLTRTRLTSVDGEPGVVVERAGADARTPGAGGRARRAAAAALAAQAANRDGATVLGSLPSGWRSIVGPPQLVSYADGERTLPLAYRFVGTRLELAVDDAELGARVRLLAASADAVTLEVDGIRRRYTVRRVADRCYVDGPDGSSALRELPRFPDPADAVHAGSLLAPMPGSVVRVLASVGDAVTVGQPLIVLEAMKMEHTIAAPADGELAELAVSAADQVDTGQLLAVVAEPE